MRLGESRGASATHMSAEMHSLSLVAIGKHHHLAFVVGIAKGIAVLIGELDWGVLRALDNGWYLAHRLKIRVVIAAHMNGRP